MGGGSGGGSAGAEGAGVVAHSEEEDAQDMHVFSLGGESGGHLYQAVHAFPHLALKSGVIPLRSAL